MKFKLIASGVGLFGYGALLAWAITADRADGKVKELLNDIEDLRKIIRDKNERIVEVEATLTNWSNWHNDGIGPKKEEPEEDEDEDYEDEDEDVIDPTEPVEETRENLQNIIDRYTNNPDDRDTFIERAQTVMEVDHTPPFVISREIYSWDPEEGDDYTKITITYYPGNRVLLDDDQDPVEDVENTVGWKNLNRFGDESADPDVVFIRNRAMLTDFEVVREEDSELPLHVKYGMPRSEFETSKAAGLIKFREGDV